MITTQVRRAGLIGPCMQVAVGRRYRSMPKRGLYQMKRCPVIEGMRGASMPQPVRAHWRINARAARCLTDNLQDSRAVQTQALHRAERVNAGRKLLQLPPDGFRKQNRSRPAAG